MNVKIDENLPVEVADDVKGFGHDADTVHDEGLTGASDEDLLDKVKDEHRAFFTMDKGIADVRAYPPDEFDGRVLFRSHTTGRSATRAFVLSHLPVLLTSDLVGRLVVVSPAGIRVR